MKIIQIDEITLVNGLKNQQHSKYEILYRNYAQALRINICRYVKNEEDAEHLLQDTFIKIWLNIDKYDSSKGRLYAWMMNLSKNLAIDFLRTKRRKYEANEVSLNQFDDYFVNVSSTSDSLDFIGIDTIIGKLKPSQIQVIDLHYFMGYSFKQAAQYLNIPEGTYKTQIYKALKQLKIYFKDEFKHEISYH